MSDVKKLIEDLEELAKRSCPTHVAHPQAVWYQEHVMEPLQKSLAAYRAETNEASMSKEALYWQNRAFLAEEKLKASPSTKGKTWLCTETEEGHLMDASSAVVLKVSGRTIRVAEVTPSQPVDDREAREKAAEEHAESEGDNGNAVISHNAGWDACKRFYFGGE